MYVLFERLWRADAKGVERKGQTMPNKVFVIGVGMTKFEKPGSREGWDYPDMAREAGTKALDDAGVDYREVEEAYVGYVYGESTSGQRAVYELGMTGVPVVNVNNNCSTGSTACALAGLPIVRVEPCRSAVRWVAATTSSSCARQRATSGCG